VPAGTYDIVILARSAVDPDRMVGFSMSYQVRLLEPPQPH
jgi:hypothetical protein